MPSMYCFPSGSDLSKKSNLCMLSSMTPGSLKCWKSFSFAERISSRRARRFAAAVLAIASLGSPSVGPLTNETRSHLVLVCSLFDRSAGR